MNISLINISRGVILGLVSLFLTGPLLYMDALSQAHQDERLVALVHVDTHMISLGVFKKSYVDYLIATGSNDTEGNRQKHLQVITDAYLIGDEARRRGFEKDTQFIQFSDLQRKKALGGRFYELEVLDKMEVLTDAEKRAAYAKFNSKVHVRQLYFANETEADHYYERLEDGDDFIDLANEVNQTVAYDSSAGDMGFISYFEIDDALAEAAFDLEKKLEYTRPIRSRSGYHILRLENRLTTAMLTESAFQAHGIGVGEDMQLRNIRLRGDAFVRDFMDSLNYKVNEETIALLAARIKAMMLPEEEGLQTLLPGDREELSYEEAEEIQALLTPETPLVTYSWQGVAQVFTAGDYFEWINHVPYGELKSNPAASIGRALRNEVMGLAGEEAGLDADPIVRASIIFEEQLYLASKVKESLRKDTTQKPTDEMVRSAFDRMTSKRKKSIQVDYWKIETTSLENAKLIRDQIESGEEQPSSFAAYQTFNDIDVFEEPAWASKLRQAPLNTLMVAGLRGGQWTVFQVAERNVTTYQFDEVRASLEKQLMPYAGEYFLLRQLYQDADIKIDQAQFDQWPTR